MFVQVIEAKTKDREAIRSEMDRWIQELGPTSEGWLGSTEGVTQDGRFIAIARFESEEQARRNSDKPEQGEWWQRASQHFEGEATFWEATDTAGEGSDSAGFVQVMKGRVNDLEAAKRLDQQMEREMPDKRPDVIGSFTAYREDGTFYSAIYFTSLEEARQAEKEMNENPPPEMEQWGALMDGELTFYDLEEPWLHSR
jgi:hypothetical protein